MHLFLDEAGPPARPAAQDGAEAVPVAGRRKLRSDIVLVSFEEQKISYSWDGSPGRREILQREGSRRGKAVNKKLWHGCRGTGGNPSISQDEEAMIMIHGG
jgi:hypothetical protein